ncbi:LamG domain-containing protein [Corallococcus praedator]|uniref:LamG domain-containing protein n=1 Tax=Corallococcus praedator TaxID=2316724 RepID=A0ABX9QE47_9BACT|nr:LamG domain-containing protein [Corallococcus sp. CA031C]RKI03280.1 LamG domain-containing protein [Corallococcus praedator]
MSGVVDIPPNDSPLTQGGGVKGFKWCLATTVLAVVAPIQRSEAIPHRITTGLVGEWKTTVTSQSLPEVVPDSSGLVYSTSHDQTGTVVGGLAQADGWTGLGMNLAGDKYVQVPHSPYLSFGTGDFTLTAWVRMLDTTRTVKTIIDNRGSDGRGYTFAVVNGNTLDLLLSDSAGSTHHQSNPSLSPLLVANRWHHVAVSVRRTTWPAIATFFVDGIPVGTASPRLGSIVNTDLPFLIGGNNDGSGYRFSDRIDEVIVFNVGLSDADLPYVTKPGKPAFAPTYWNDPSRQSVNNCYNYATTKATNTFAQPGRHSGAVASTMDCASVVQAALNDGLELLSGYPDSSGYKSAAALVVAPGYDYHWYRRGTDNLWTHKPGGTAATNLDNLGLTISDPATANRGVYTQFCGYFRVWSDSVDGSGHENIN